MLRDRSNEKRQDALIALALARAHGSGGGAAAAVQEIRFAIGTAAAQNSLTSIPAGAVVVDAEIKILIPYSLGATIAVGNAGTPALLMATSDSNPQAAALYQVPQDTPFVGGPATVLVTVAGAPGAGSGLCIVRYVATPQG